MIIHIAVSNYILGAFHLRFLFGDVYHLYLQGVTNRRNSTIV